MAKSKITGLFLIILFCFSAYRCDDSASPSADSTVLTESEAADLLRDELYYLKKSQYNPDSLTVREIAEVFNRIEFRFAIFFTKGCSCDNDEKKYRFPHAMKVFEASGITSGSYSIYYMKNINSAHPYDSILRLNSLPAVFLLRDNVPVCSITDSSDESNRPIEQEILESLKGN